MPPPPRDPPPRPSDPAAFDEHYRSRPPWDIGRPQPSFVRLAESGGIRGSVLDVGCGTGEQALLAASLGLETTGLDGSPTAIELAKQKARDRGLEVAWIVGDAMRLADLGRSFDTVLDSGLFHVFDDDDRVRFVDGLRAVVAPGGRYAMLCFSDRVPGEFGPRRVSQAEIRTSFADGWQIVSIEDATMDVTFSPAGIPAWFSTIERA